MINSILKRWSYTVWKYDHHQSASMINMSMKAWSSRLHRLSTGRSEPAGENLYDQWKLSLLKLAWTAFWGRKNDHGRANRRLFWLPFRISPSLWCNFKQNWFDTFRILPVFYHVSGVDAWSRLWPCISIVQSSMDSQRVMGHFSMHTLLLSPYQAYTRRKLAEVFHAFGRIGARIDLQPLLLDHFSDLLLPPMTVVWAWFLPWSCFVIWRIHQERWSSGCSLYQAKIMIHEDFRLIVESPVWLCLPDHSEIIQFHYCFGKFTAPAVVIEPWGWNLVNVAPAVN